jgi:hypothetical protein
LLFARFYGFLVLGLLVLSQFPSSVTVLIFAVLSFWVPQIVHNAKLNAGRTLTLPYVLGMSCTRLVCPLYFYGYADNFLGRPQNVPLCVAMVCWVALQTLVLLLQNFCGAQFFVPACCLPAKYNYHRPMPLRRVVVDAPADAPSAAAAAAESVDASASAVAAEPTVSANAAAAAISVVESPESSGSTPTSSELSDSVSERQHLLHECNSSSSSSSSVSDAGSINSNSNNCNVASAATATIVPSISASAAAAAANDDNEIMCSICLSAIDDNPRLEDIMVTPCDHVYHSECLLPWLEQKSQCPICRAALPPA